MVSVKSNSSGGGGQNGEYALTHDFVTPISKLGLQISSQTEQNFNIYFNLNAYD